MTENRESWLTRAVLRLAALFDAAEYGRKLAGKRFRVSVGWPSTRGRAVKARKLGECWPARESSDGTFELFVSPTLDSPVEALAVVLHEMTHAVSGREDHRGEFVTVFNALGFLKPPTQQNPGGPLKAELDAIASELGAFPHAAVTVPPPKPRATNGRLLKLACPIHDDGTDEEVYSVWSSRKTLQRGIPLCGATDAAGSACAATLAPVGWDPKLLEPPATDAPTTEQEPAAEQAA